MSCPVKFPMNHFNAWLVLEEIQLKTNLIDIDCLKTHFGFEYVCGMAGLNGFYIHCSITLFFNCLS